MANYSNLLTSIQSVVKTNGAGAITGANLQTKLLEMVASLGAGYQFMGVATPTTNPGTPDQKVCYIAAQSGAYVNFDNLTIANGKFAILRYDNVWSKLEINLNDIGALTDSDIVNDLITGGINKALSAEQGKVIKLMTDVNAYIFETEEDGFYLIDSGMNIGAALTPTLISGFESVIFVQQYEIN